MYTAISSMRTPLTAISGLALEVPPAAGGEAEAVARRQRGGGGGAGGAELGAQRRIAQQALGDVPVAQAAGQHAVLDEVGAPGRQPLAGDPLGAHQSRSRAVVVDRERR